MRDARDRRDDGKAHRVVANAQRRTTRKVSALLVPPPVRWQTGKRVENASEREPRSYALNRQTFRQHPPTAPTASTALNRPPDRNDCSNRSDHSDRSDHFDHSDCSDYFDRSNCTKILDQNILLWWTKRLPNWNNAATNKLAATLHIFRRRNVTSIDVPISVWRRIDKATHAKHNLRDLLEKKFYEMKKYLH